MNNNFFDDAPKCPDCKKQFHWRTFQALDREFKTLVRSCDCQDRKDREREAVEIYESYLKESNIPEICREKNFDIPDETVIERDGEIVKTFLDYYKFKRARDDFEFIFKNFSGLFVPGTWGTRKTTYSCEVAKAVMSSGRPAIYYQAGEIITRRISIYDLLDVYFLIIDDLGFDKIETRDGLLFTLINKRIEKRRPTCLVTNYGEDHLREMFGTALVDRIKLFYTIPMIGPSSRIEKQI